MKTIYKCEKCGAEYEVFEDCAKCEDGHVQIYSGGNTGKVLNKLAKFKQGDKVPYIAVIRTDDRYCELENGKYGYKCEYAEYKLVRVLGGEERKEIEDEIAELDRKDEEEWKRYLAEREAKQKAEQEQLEESAEQTNTETA